MMPRCVGLRPIATGPSAAFVPHIVGAYGRPPNPSRRASDVDHLGLRVEEDPSHVAVARQPLHGGGGERQRQLQVGRRCAAALKQSLERRRDLQVRTLPAPLWKRPAIQRMVCHLDEPVGEAPVKPPVVALTIALRQRIQRSSESGTALWIENPSDPHYSALTLCQVQRTRLRNFRLLIRITLGIDEMSVVMAEVAEPTDAEGFCLS